MSYADQLRNLDPKARKAEMTAKRAMEDSADMLSAVQQACGIAANNGKRRISGYVRWYQDDGYPQKEFVSELPSVKQYQEADSKPSRFHTNSSYALPGTYTHEERLYSGYIIIPNEPSYLRQVGANLILKIKKLGFTKYKMQILKLDDFYIVHKTTVGHILGLDRNSLTIRKDPKPVYILKIEIEW